MWCELTPGSVVSEASLVERLGLNRAGVRAGLLALEAQGLVESAPRHGWRVRPISGRYIAEVIAARGVLEAGLTLERLNEVQVERIEEIARMNAVLARRREPASRDSLGAHDREILEILFNGFGDIRRRWLSEIWDHCERLVRFFETAGGRLLEPIDRRPLATACRSGDEAGARACLRQALEATESFFTAALLEQDTEIRRPGGIAPTRRANADRRTLRSADSSQTPLQPKDTV
jgi:DNA-binding GntR family transcriptional regulator